MSIEEKARAYDEALKKMQPLYEQAKKDDNPILSTYEYLFPQLQESENERIRKELIFFLKEEIVQCSIKEHADKLKEFVSYLEKQKENPKTADSISPDVKCEDRHNKPGDFIFELRQIISRHWWADEHSDRIEDEEGMAKEILELCEKQKEQKPAEWSEYDEKMLNNIIGTIAYAWGETSDRVSWLKSLPERFDPQPKQEWSKEDEKMLNQIEYRLKDWDNIKERQGYQDNHASPSPIKWIKSLPERFNIRPQQKDNECISPEEGDIVVNKYGEISVFENWGHHPDGGSFNDRSYFFAKCTLVGDNYDDYDCCPPDSAGLRYATPEEIRKIVPYILKEKV